MMILDGAKLEEAEKALREGKVIIFPTETSYALGCDATNEEAVARIFAIKGREGKKGLPILLPDLSTASRYVAVDALFHDLATRFWPGPLNIVTKAKEGSPVSKRALQDGTQSVRLSSHPFAGTLARRFQKPIVATSANISGKDAMYSVKGAEKAFAHSLDKPDLVIDAGILPFTPVSTTVDISTLPMRIIRQGGIRL